MLITTNSPVSPQQATNSPVSQQQRLHVAVVGPGVCKFCTLVSSAPWRKFCTCSSDSKQCGTCSAMLMAVLKLCTLENDPGSAMCAACYGSLATAPDMLSPESRASQE